MLVTQSNKEVTAMISNDMSLVPHEKTARSVALCFAEIIKKNGKLRGATPLANSFCRHYFGKSRPKKMQLLSLAECSLDNVPMIMDKLDRFLRSNGEKRYLVSWYFANCAFPSKAVNADTRLNNHCEMMSQRSAKISDKQDREHAQFIEIKKTEILAIAHRNLPEWIADESDHLSEFELNQCLQNWYKTHDTSDYRFSDLYCGMSASRIALDLSFDD